MKLTSIASSIRFVVWAPRSSEKDFFVSRTERLGALTPSHFVVVLRFRENIAHPKLMLFGDAELRDSIQIPDKKILVFMLELRMGSAPTRYSNFNSRSQRTFGLLLGEEKPRLFQ